MKQDNINCMLKSQAKGLFKVIGFVKFVILHHFFLLFIILPFQAFSQTYFFEYIKKANYGLANEKVYSVVIDKNQKIWMGTGDGLSTYDGRTIENFSKINGIAEYGINSLFIDSRGFIWMGHRKGGISRYNGKIFESRTDRLIFKDKDITSIGEDAEGNIWITSDGAGAIKIINPLADLYKIEYEQYKGNRLGDQVFNCTLLKDRKMYFITSPSSIKYYNTKQNNFSLFKKNGIPAFFEITCLLEDNEQNLWMGTYHGGLYVYDKKIDSVRFYDIRDGLASNYISTIYQDSKRNIWVGHYEGGGITQIKNGKIVQVLNKDNGLNDYRIYAITEDREGNILIGTRENGLAILKDLNFTLFLNNEKQFNNTEIWSITEDKDKKIWFGTNNGVVIYNRNPKKDEKVFSTIEGEDYFKPKQVRFIKKDKDQNLWFGTADFGLFLYNYKTGSFSSPLILDDFKEITALEIDKDNNLWIGARERNAYLYVYNPKTEAGATFMQGNGLISSDVNSIYIDKNNVKYIGSGQGLTIVKDSINIDCPKYELGGATPNCITGDNEGNIWIGTLNRGVLCFKNGKIIRQFSRNEGLLSDVISFVSYFKGSLFVGTGIGMNRIDLKTNDIYIYTNKNGLPGIETKRNAVFVDSENALWVGTINGGLRYAPRSEKQTISDPLPHINRFMVNDEIVEMKRKTKLRFNQNRLVFDFYCVSLTNSDAIIYKYILEGGNSAKWQYTNYTETEAKYQALRPGTYTFKVMARNYAGVWSSQPATFTFRINPPFYGTWWFISACVIAGLIILFTYIKVREKKLVREKHILEQKVEQRTLEISKINKQLALKNKDIVDSIHYASRIQNALIPSDLPFSNTFVLFKPKDIVSGDFFWCWANENMEFMAAVDCTGHGVPGAFMSIIGHNSLNKIVQESKIYKPSEILNRLNSEVADTLHQYHHDNQIHDGMDIALISYDKNSQLLEFSGAFNPLWLIRNNTLTEIRANRYAIGLAPGIVKDFTNNEIKLESGDTIYLFSDGYADQFGGPDNKKLKVGYFKEVLLGIQDLSMEKQKEHLDSFIETWKGDTDQIDDILIIGRRFEF